MRTGSRAESTIGKIDTNGEGDGEIHVEKMLKVEPAKIPTAASGGRNKRIKPRIRSNHPTTVTTTGRAPPGQTLWPRTIARPAVKKTIPKVRSNGEL
jgi:hypothetical protein